MPKSIYPSAYVHTQGTIIERFAETVFKASLPNGKVAIAFVEKKKAFLRDELSPGDRVELTICPSDFDRARIDAKI